MNSQGFLLRCGNSRFDVDLFLPGHTGLVVTIGVGLEDGEVETFSWPKSLTVEM